MYLLLETERELCINSIKQNIWKFWFEKIVASAVKMRKNKELNAYLK